MLRHELDRMVHVSRLKHENAAELFLGFRIGTICRRHFSVLAGERQRGFRRLYRFATGPMPSGAKMVVVCKACVEHRVALSLSHAREFIYVVVSKTNVFHFSSPRGSWWAFPNLINNFSFDVRQFGSPFL